MRGEDSMIVWQDRAEAKKDRKRRGLEAKGYASEEADRLVEWAFSMAARRSPPEKNAVEFLGELDRQLSICDRFVKR
jgi:hypothetical protein